MAYWPKLEGQIQRSNCPYFFLCQDQVGVKCHEYKIKEELIIFNKIKRVSINVIW